MSAAAAEEKHDSPAAGASSGGGGSKLVLIISLVNFVATVAIIAILMISFQKQKTTSSVEDIQAGGEHHAEGGAPAEGAHGEAAKTEHGGGGSLLGRKKPEFGKMVTLEQFTVNLSTPGSSAPKFARANVALEVTTDDAEAEVNAKMPQIRNVILDLFNSKRPNDLATPEGRDYLKEEIRNALNGFMVHGKIKGVYFTNFGLSG